MAEKYKINKVYYKDSRDFGLSIELIPEEKNVSHFLNSDFVISKSIRNWFLNGVEEVLNGKKLLNIMEGDNVELRIEKQKTKVLFTLHENLNVSLETFMDSAENIEDIIDTKELYAIMIEWNKILNKS